MENKIIHTATTKTGKTVSFRYPTVDDVQILTDYINKISSEKTFITFQGEQQTLESEKEYLKSELDKIKKNNCAYLLAFINNKLVGSAAIDLEDKVESHVGVFGITVAKEYRGDGIGKLLLVNILKEAKKLKKIKIIILQVYSPNTLAQNLYQKMGFIEYGRLPGGIKYRNKYVDAILMYKKVK